ncbi:hypothetical protein [Paraburkholderia unamae]|uniref:Uncharacterized protein n=1 Tax=Paraburkholderia unamae TaxID=219649 RepID=A0ABX5KJI9_9BURK|nr:hypothetical protein [Paraburkholderia unamae]PVX77203.1 hypothetical protein C7402_115262 [Paraburkholderia unamae]
MIRHKEPGISVRISDEGLRRAYGDNDMLNRLKRVERIHKVIAVVASWGFACGLGIVIAWSACNGA